MFQKILIANRGEIAVRIIRTCKRVGVKTVAVYSEPDYRSPYVEEADEAAFIGGPRAQDSFLKQEKIISVALEFGCQAVHPGYGFLSENATFAQAVADNGMVFIGPPSSAISLLGDKVASKILATRVGVPVVPGHEDALGDLDEALEIIDRIGLPVFLKPAAGGGGRGMRLVRTKEELASALASSKEETRKGFGDDRIFAERYIPKPRHIEFQIMADNYGNVIHLGERECTIQRRHQKVIEETPSVALSHSMRVKMGEMACRLAQEVGYTNAGTVEFILDSEGNFYFLEMNTRLQVEHPITELVTSLDLVELQLRIAAGEELPIKQEDVVINGWAIEARICAEDPSRGFLPTTGMITRYAQPKGKTTRVDSGVGPGSVITIYYDSLLAKVAAWGENREIARRALVRALNGYHIEGLTTNVDFANAILNHPVFLSGDLSTDFIEEHYADGESKIPPPLEILSYMSMAVILVYHNRRNLVRDSLKPMSPSVGVPQLARRAHDYVIRVDRTILEARLEEDQPPYRWRITVDGRIHEIIAPEFEYYRRRLKLTIDGVSHMFRLQYENNHIKAFFCGVVRTFEIYDPREWRLAHYMLRDRKVVQENVLKCPMPGMVTTVSVEEGTDVRRGQEILRMESMKMETGVASPVDGLIEKIMVYPGDAVETDQVLVMFKT